MRTLFVHEYVSGGGFAGRPLPDGLLSEGRAMLSALLSDLAAFGGRRIVTTLDARLDLRAPDGVEVVRVPAGAHAAVFDEIAASADAAWITAPETEGILAELTSRAEARGASPIGSPSEAIRLASDKLALARRLREVGVPVPRTWSAERSPAAVREGGLPLVLKPVLGAGCEGVRLARDGLGLRDALAAAAETGRAAIVQEYVEGVAASASVLCVKGRAVPLSLNGQAIRVGRTFRYEGGWLPLRHSQAEAALAAACRACETVPGLRGYAGVDLVLGPRGPVVIEINPRLTTPYVGLRAAVRGNVSGWVLAAVEEGTLPERVEIARAVRFAASGAVEVEAA